MRRDVSAVATFLLVSVFVFRVSNAGWEGPDDGTAQTIDVQENVNDTNIFNATFVAESSCSSPTFAVDVDYLSLQASIDASTWLVKVQLISPLDADTTEGTLEFRLTADCTGEFMRVYIVVTDVIDSAPQFTPDHYMEDVSENTTVNSTLLEIRATDTDNLDSIVYTVNLPAAEEEFFDYIDYLDYIAIILKSPLDYESRQIHHFTVTGTDTAGYNSTCDVTINVINVADAQPVFSQSVYFASVKENVTEGTSIIQLSASDGDGLEGTGIMYSHVSGGETLFHINSTTGLVTTAGEIDAESPDIENGMILMIIMAQESHTEDMNTTVELYVEVIDLDDNDPSFSSPSFTGTISESAQPGDYLTVSGSGFVEIDDPDQSSAHNEYTIRVERAGQPWSAIRPSVERAHGRASILFRVDQDSVLDDVLNAELIFQVVVESVPSEGSMSSRTGSISAEVALAVGDPSAVPLSSGTTDDDISTADIFVFILAVLVIANIVITLLIFCWLRRGQAAASAPLFRRNSKYYVSKRSGQNVPTTLIEKLENGDGDAEIGGSDIVRESSRQESAEMRAETTQDAYESYNSKDTRVQKSDSNVGTTDILAPTRAAPEDAPVKDHQNSLSAAVNRNRCDVTLLSDKKLFTEPKSGTSEASKTQSSDSTSRDLSDSQDRLMSLLDEPGKGQRPDVTRLERENSNAPSLGSESGADVKGVDEVPSGYVNVPTPGVQGTTESTPNQCDVVPTEQSVGFSSKGLSELLRKVHEKLNPKVTTLDEKEKDCDVVPLYVACKEEDTESTKSISHNSSFSYKSQIDEAPLIKPARVGKSEPTEKEGETISKQSKPSVQGQSNPAFFNADSSQKEGTLPTNMTSGSVGQTAKNNPNITKVDLVEKAAAKLPLSAPTNTTGGGAPIITSPKETKLTATTYPVSASQLSRPGVPPVALALPSFNGTSPNLNEDYFVINNPVYEPYVISAAQTPTTKPEKATVHTTKTSNSVKKQNPAETMNTARNTSPSETSQSKRPNSPTENYMTKAKSLLSEVASSMINETTASQPATSQPKCVRIAEPDDVSTKKPEKLTKF